MSAIGELRRVQYGSWVSSLDACDDPHKVRPTHMGYINDNEYVIFLGKKIDYVSRELYLIVLTRFGVGVVHPTAL